MLTSLALVFLLGLLAGALCKALRLPSLVGMLLTGILLGPYALNLLDASLLSVSAQLRTLALVVILTRAGLSLNIGELKKVGRPALLMCFVPACCEIAGMVLLAPPLLGISVLEAAILGSVIAAVSPAVVVPRMLRLMQEGCGTQKSIPQMILAGASVDDVVVIVLFTSFVSLESGGEVSLLRFAEIPISIILGIAIGALAGFLLYLFFRKFHMRDSAKVLVLLGVSFLFLELEKRLAQLLPFSGLLAVMAAGVILLRRSPAQAERLSAKFGKIWVAAEILLFVLVGAAVDVRFAAAAGGKAVVLLLLVLIFRMAGVLLCLLRTGLNRRERLFCMIAYLPKATVQAAIGGIPLAMGLPCGSLVLTVAVLSILVTAPLGAFGVDLTYKKLLQKE